MKFGSGVKSSNNVSNVVSSGKEIARKRSLSHQLQQNDDDLATLLRHSADDEDEGDEEVDERDPNLVNPFKRLPRGWHFFFVCEPFEILFGPFGSHF